MPRLPATCPEVIGEGLPSQAQALGQERLYPQPYRSASARVCATPSTVTATTINKSASSTRPPSVYLHLLQGVECPKIRNGAVVAHVNTLTHILINLRVLQRTQLHKAEQSRGASAQVTTA